MNFKINGILLINKLHKITSNDIINKIKKQIQNIKIGHLGTLDPSAIGLLIISLYNNNIIIKCLINKNKRYIIYALVGIKTFTKDLDGKIKFINKNILTTKYILLNNIIIIQYQKQQTPPNFSSIKHNGIPLYKYSRLHIKLHQKQNNIIIFKIKLLNIYKNLIILDIKCSKGTYIREIINNLNIFKPICTLKIIRISINNYTLLNSYDQNINLKNILY